MEFGEVLRGFKLSLECIPNMLYKIRIRRHGRLLHALDIFSFNEVINDGRTVRTCIIIHEYESRADSTSKQANVRLKDFISVSYSNNSSSVEDVEVCAAIQRYTWSHHDSALNENYIFLLCLSD